MRPLVIELYCGSFGWSRGFVAEGFRAVGFDIEHQAHHGDVPDGCELVLQDVRTLDGAQFREAECIVASPPCQQYSWLAMPWSRSKSEHSQAAKALRRKWETEGPDNSLFDACFRIQREAIEAAGRYIPLIVENVRGAQEWVGRAAWNFGSFYLWGDVPALMPIAFSFKVPSITGRRTAPGNGARFTSRDCGIERDGLKAPCAPGERITNRRPHLTNPAEQGTKIGGDWFSDPKSTCRRHGSRSNARRAASAQIARIPFDLANHIARVYRPREAA